MNIWVVMINGERDFASPIWREAWERLLWVQQNICTGSNGPQAEIIFERVEF